MYLKRQGVTTKLHQRVQIRRNLFYSENLRPPALQCDCVDVWHEVINLGCIIVTICYSNAFCIVQQVLSCQRVISRHCAWPYISIYYLYFLHCAHAATLCEFAV